MVAQQFIDEAYQKFTIKDNIIFGVDTVEVKTDGISKQLLNTLSEAPNFVGQLNVQTGEKITFAQVKDRSIRCALWLQKQGITKDDIICISTPNQMDDYVPYFATLFVGAIYNPWYHDLTPAVTRQFFELLQPKIMFACEQSIDRLAKGAEEVNVQCKFVVYGKHSRFPSLRDLMAQQSQAEIDNFRHVEPENPKEQCGVIFFSSGTTGNQKGTMLSFDHFLNLHEREIQISGKKYALWYSSLSWISGSSFLILCTLNMCTRIIINKFDCEDMSKLVENYKIDWAFITSSMLTQLYKSKVCEKYDYSSLKFLITAGSKVCKQPFEEMKKALPHVLLSNCYGMTEAGGCISLQTKNCKISDSIGFVGSRVQLKIVDKSTGRTLGPNEEGEICVKKSTMMLGYYKNSPATESMIDKEGWLHTGDIGYYDDSGEISITERMKFVIITQNVHVSPSIIENLLLEHSDVKEAAVVPVPHQVDIERPFAFVIKRPGSKVTAEELIELPASYDKYFRLTGGLKFVDKIPCTPTGKKCFRELKKMAKVYVHSNYSFKL